MSTITATLTPQTLTWIAPEGLPRWVSADATHFAMSLDYSFRTTLLHFLRKRSYKAYESSCDIIIFVWPTMLCGKLIATGIRGSRDIDSKGIAGVIRSNKAFLLYNLIYKLCPRHVPLYTHTPIDLATTWPAILLPKDRSRTSSDNETFHRWRCELYIRMRGLGWP